MKLPSMNTPMPKRKPARKWARNEEEDPIIPIVNETTDAVIAAINSASRAMVVLSVPWSVYAVSACADFRKAVARLNEIGLPLEAFILDEESVVCQRWLASLGLPEPYNGIPCGCGIVIWLESGRVVSLARGMDERMVGLIGQAKALWQIE